MRGQPPFERQANLRDLLTKLAAGPLRGLIHIQIAGRNNFRHSSAGYAQGVACHWCQLDAGVPNNRLNAVPFRMKLAATRT